MCWEETKWAAAAVAAVAAAAAAAAQSNFPRLILHTKTLCEKMHGGNLIITPNSNLHRTHPQPRYNAPWCNSIGAHTANELYIFRVSGCVSQSCKRSHIIHYHKAVSGVRQRCLSGSMATWETAALMCSSATRRRQFVIFHKESVYWHKSPVPLKPLIIIWLSTAIHSHGEASEWGVHVPCKGIRQLLYAYFCNNHKLRSILLKLRVIHKQKLVDVRQK